MFLSRKGGVESKWPRERVVTARISVDQWHGGMNEMKCTRVKSFIVQLKDDQAYKKQSSTGQDRKEISEVNDYRI